jgi:N-acetylglucosamine kinase-like BadF-type ATPase
LVVPDIEVAFAAGTADPAGTVLIAGTGAVAARIEKREIAARADGVGWLLGDEGSGVWLGRRAAASAVAAMDGRGPRTVLMTAVPAALGVVADVQAVIGAVYAAPPSALGALARVVDAAAGDPVADEIIAEAASRLVRTVRAVGGGGPVVLAGGLLAAPTRVSERVRAALAASVPVVARDGAAGAAALAVHATGTPGALAAHRKLLSGAGL